MSAGHLAYELLEVIHHGRVYTANDITNRAKTYLRRRVPQDEVMSAMRVLSRCGIISITTPGGTAPPNYERVDDKEASK